MKTLQNNFTTPVQSKGLLELGVPADSADCIRVIDTDMIIVAQEGITYYVEKYNTERKAKAEPCWSVGRLLEIFKKCYNESNNPFCYTQNMIEDIIRTFQDCKIDMDFSKLED